MWLELFLLALAIGLLYFYFSKPSKDFWSDYGIRQITNSSFIDKASVFIGKKTLADFDRVAYEEMGRTGESYVGVVEMQQPVLIIRDLEIIKKIMIKDFDHFTDRRSFGSLNTQPILNKFLTVLKGEEWKGVRTALSPTFTTGKIRRMMEYFNNISLDWTNHIQTMINKSDDDHVDIKVHEQTTRYTIDVISASVFGIKSESIGNPENRLALMCKNITKSSAFAMIKIVLALTFPRIANYLNLKIIDEEAINFFEGVMNQGLKERVDGTVKANDFLQLMAEARKGDIKAKGSDELSAFEKEAQVEVKVDTKKNWLADDLTANAQLLQFFFAGFSTSTNFISFCLYCLALNQDAQDKLRDAVKPLFENGQDIDYDELNQICYLEMVTCEVLRHYPAAVGRLERVSVKDYHDEESGFKVPKGAMMAIPIESIHRDIKYYERPNDFYPEHFSPEKKSDRSPYAYLPFGVGPRNCIGMRFALMAGKAALARIVHNYKIEPSKSTPIPIKVQPIGFAVAVPHNLELKLSAVQKIKNN